MENFIIRIVVFVVWLAGGWLFFSLFSSARKNRSSRYSTPKLTIWQMYKAWRGAQDMEDLELEQVAEMPAPLPEMVEEQPVSYDSEINRIEWGDWTEWHENFSQSNG